MDRRRPIPRRRPPSPRPRSYPQLLRKVESELPSDQGAPAQPVDDLQKEALVMVGKIADAIVAEKGFAPVAKAAEPAAPSEIHIHFDEGAFTFPEQHHHINIEPPAVTVEAPAVTVENHVHPPKPRAVKVVTDKKGNRTYIPQEEGQ